MQQYFDILLRELCERNFGVEDYSPSMAMRNLTQSAKVEYHVEKLDRLADLAYWYVTSVKLLFGTLDYVRLRGIFLDEAHNFMYDLQDSPSMSARGTPRSSWGDHNGLGVFETSSKTREPEKVALLE
jgi:hypothetical protein